MSPSETPRNPARWDHSVGTEALAWKVRSALRVSATNAPFSPVMTVTRSFIGVSQLTRWLATVAVRQLAGDRHEVLVGPPGSVGSAGRHRDVVLLGDPGRQVDVMGAEVLDHTDVGDARREGADPPGAHLVDLAEVAVRQPRSGLLQRRVVALDVAHPADQSSAVEGGDDLGCLGAVGGQGLLDQCVDAGIGQFHGDVVVVGAWARPPRSSRYPARSAASTSSMDRPAGGCAVGVAQRIGDADQFDVGEAAQDSWRGDVPSCPVRSDRPADVSSASPLPRG